MLIPCHRIEKLMATFYMFSSSKAVSSVLFITTQQSISQSPHVLIPRLRSLQQCRPKMPSEQHPSGRHKQILQPKVKHLALS